MTKSCYFAEANIFGLSSSAIEITENFHTTIIKCLISSCTSADGAGIHTKYGILNVTKTCIEKCRASVEGDAIRSYCDTRINLSSVSRCAENTKGNDDNIDIQDNSVALVYELNDTNAFTQEAVFQIFSCPQAIISRCLFSKGMADAVVQYHQMTVPVDFEDCIVTNNSVSRAIFLILASKPLYFRGSIFTGNKAPKMFTEKSTERIPQIYFENVVFIENYTIDFDVIYATETSFIPTFDEMKETFICNKKDLEIITLKCKFKMNRMALAIFWQII